MRDQSKLLFVAILFALSATANTEDIVRSASSFDKSLSILYKATSAVQTSEDARQRVYDQKKQQYDSMVSAGKVTQAQEDSILESIKTMPSQTMSTYSLQFSFFSDHLLVTKRGEDGKTAAWTYIDSKSNVSKGWQGGDALSLGISLEPYSVSNAQVPILPIQLLAYKSFADIHVAGDVVTMRGIVTSTTSSDYVQLVGKLSAGHLVATEAGNIERSAYFYDSDSSLLPSRIVLERNKGPKGEWQTTTTYSGTEAIVDSSTLADLVEGDSVQVVDYRTNPPKQFIYKKKLGSILDQAASGTAMPARQSIPVAAQPNLRNIALIAIGLVLVFLISLRQMFQKKEKIRK